MTPPSSAPPPPSDDALVLPTPMVFELEQIEEMMAIEEQEQADAEAEEPRWEVDERAEWKGGGHAHDDVGSQSETGSRVQRGNASVGNREESLRPKASAVQAIFEHSTDQTLARRTAERNFETNRASEEGVYTAAQSYSPPAKLNLTYADGPIVQPPARHLEQARGGPSLTAKAVNTKQDPQYLPRPPPSPPRSPPPPLPPSRAGHIEPEPLHLPRPPPPRSAPPPLPPPPSLEIRQRASLYDSADSDSDNN